MKKLLRRIFGRERYSWRPSWASIKRESTVHPHCAAERAEQFESLNTGSTEYEVLDWLYATIRLLKPNYVLETGAFDGLGTIALASACRSNGFGKVCSIELNKEACARLTKRMAHEGLSDFVEVHCADSREYLRSTETVFDIGFFDSVCEIRADECKICFERHLLTQVAVFHDTASTRCDTLDGWPARDLHNKYRNDIYSLVDYPDCTGSFESPLSRGFIALFLSRNADRVRQDD